KALFRRATELGILLGGADRTTHLFGRRITARYGGKLQTVLDRRNEGQPILRSYYGSSFVKQYEKGDRLLRTETCLNNTYDVGIGRHLDNLPALRERMLATNTRYLETQAELLASTVDTGEPGALARPGTPRRRRAAGPRAGRGAGAGGRPRDPPLGRAASSRQFRGGLAQPRGVRPPAEAASAHGGGVPPRSAPLRPRQAARPRAGRTDRDQPPLPP